MPEINLEMLRTEYACAPQIRKFRDTFGDCVEVTPEKCVEYAQEFDWEWAREHLLTGEIREEARQRFGEMYRAQRDRFDEVHTEGPCGEACVKVAHETEQALAQTFGELFVAQETADGLAK